MGHALLDDTADWLEGGEKARVGGPIVFGEEDAHALVIAMVCQNITHDNTVAREVTPLELTPSATRWDVHVKRRSGPPFSEGMAVGDLVFLSGQIGNRPGTVELAGPSAVDEFRQVMDNVVQTLRANGLTTGNVVKCTVMLADMADWPAFNDVYAGYFDQTHFIRDCHAFGTDAPSALMQTWIDCRP